MVKVSLTREWEGKGLVKNLKTGVGESFKKKKESDGKDLRMEKQVLREEVWPLVSGTFT